MEYTSSLRQGFGWLARVSRSLVFLAKAVRRSNLIQNEPPLQLSPPWGNPTCFHLSILQSSRKSGQSSPSSKNCRCRRRFNRESGVKTPFKVNHRDLTRGILFPILRLHDPSSSQPKLEDRSFRPRTWHPSFPSALAGRRGGLVGAPPADILAEARAWARQNRERIWSEWQKLNRG